MSEHASPDRRQRVQAALWNIRVDAATAEVSEALAAVGVRCVLLKGPALADWYPEGSVRTYVDGDLWVSPADEPLATQTLAALGFHTKIDERGLPGWWQEHASSWVRESDRGSIDLHRKLQGVRAEPAFAWERLWEETEPIELAGRTLRRLAPAARALYVTLHAAHDGNHGLRAQTHLNFALAGADESVWRRTAALAAELDAGDAFSAGLRLTGAGRQLAQRLGLPANRSVEAAIRAATAPPVALGFEQVARASAGERLSIIAHKLFPPPGFIRHWWAPAARNSAMLGVGYLYRPVWLALRAPAGYRAWRAARRQVVDGRRSASSPE